MTKRQHILSRESVGKNKCLLHVFHKRNSRQSVLIQYKQENGATPREKFNRPPMRPGVAGRPARPGTFSAFSSGNHRVKGVKVQNVRGLHLTVN